MDNKLTKIVAWLAVIISIPILKSGAAFFLALGIAFALFHPMIPWFLRMLPEKSKKEGKHSLKATGAVLALLFLILTLLLGGIVGSTWYGLQEHPSLSEEMRQSYDAEFGSEQVSAIVSKFEKLAEDLLPVLPGIAIFFFLAWEYPHLRTQIKRRFSNGNPEETLRDFEEDGLQLQRFWIARTITGFLTGTTVGLVLWFMGVPLAWLWGMLNFLLNYIPTVGSFVGVVIPVGFAMVAEVGTSGLVIAASVGTIQLIYGVIVDPLIQDQLLPMSSLTIFLAILFWGWLWGPWGALIGVPLTFTLARLSLHHPIYSKFGQLVLQDQDRNNGDD